MDKKQTTNHCIPVIEVSQDRMSATLRLNTNEEGDIYDFDGLKAVLVNGGVKAGVLLEEVTRIIEEEIYNKDVEVAKGKPPENGTDGYFIFHAENAETANKPKILEDGSVQYITTQEHTIVQEGDLLAEYVAATVGEFGYCVDSAILPPQRGKDKPVLKGKGIRVEERSRYFAAITGKIERSEMMMTVTSLLEIKGSVDVGYGHIDFQGDVWIRGDVHSGMKVKASGDVTINGHIGGCFIDAGKNLNVNNGVQGKQIGKIVAGGDVSCKFLESIQVNAKGNIMARYIMNCDVVCEGEVIVEGRGAVIMGGSVHAVQGIRANEIGTDTELPTVVSVGVSQNKMRRFSELKELIAKVEGEVDLLDRSAKMYERMEKTKITKEIQARRMKIIRAKIIKTTELRGYLKEQVEIQDLIEKGKKAVVEVGGTTFRGVQVEIKGQRITVANTVKHAKFLLKDGEVQAALLY